MFLIVAEIIMILIYDLPPSDTYLAQEEHLVNVNFTPLIDDILNNSFSLILVQSGTSWAIFTVHDSILFCC